MRIHTGEFVGEILQFVTGANIDGGLEFPSPNRLGRLLQRTDWRDDAAGGDVAQHREEHDGDAAKDGHPSKEVLDRRKQFIGRLPDNCMPGAAAQRSVRRAAGLREGREADDRRRLATVSVARCLGPAGQERSDEGNQALVG